MPNIEKIDQSFSAGEPEPLATCAEIAAVLNGTEYPVRIPKDIVGRAKSAGLVIVYGASDDLMEFEGAITDEIGCYDGGKAYLTPDGPLTTECDDENCPHEERGLKAAAVIEALWAEEGAYSWTYRTAIPHTTFEVVDDGQPYCRGIVFALKDVPAPGAVS